MSFKKYIDEIKSRQKTSKPLIQQTRHKAGSHQLILARQAILLFLGQPKIITAKPQNTSEMIIHMMAPSQTSSFGIIAVLFQKIIFLKTNIPRPMVMLFFPRTAGEPKQQQLAAMGYHPILNIFCLTVIYTQETQSMTTFSLIQT